MSNKIYPIGIQNFESLRQDGYFYIDKTALMYQMVKTGRYYFLSRPRRFGKSLLVSTLEVYFQGKKELFEGLAVEKLEKDGQGLNLTKEVRDGILNHQTSSMPSTLEGKVVRLSDVRSITYQVKSYNGNDENPPEIFRRDFV